MEAATGSKTHQVDSVWKQAEWRLVISTIIRALVLTGQPFSRDNPDNLIIFRVILAKFRAVSLPKSVVRFATARNLTHVAVALTTAVVVLAGSGVATSQSAPAQALMANRVQGGVAVSADSIAGAYIAANIAQELELPVSDNAAQQVKQLNSQSALAATSGTFITKPQVVTTDTAARREVTAHQVKSGETIASVARKYGITTDTIRWANDIGSWEGIAAGQQLTILPVSGILHKVSSGDTVESLADRYQANAAQIISFNDLEVAGLKAGDRIVIPEGVEPYQPTRSFVPLAFSGNGYDYGWCTWGAAELREQMGKPIPGNWGHAFMWKASALASGYNVGNAPKPGAIVWHAYGNHVAVVNSVNSDGSAVFTDMNYPIWGSYTTREVPASEMSRYQFIY